MTVKQRNISSNELLTVYKFGFPLTITGKQYILSLLLSEL